MTKDQVKTLCESDDKLQWWAMVLFAEICEFLEYGKNNNDMKTAFSLIQNKDEEFKHIMFADQVRKAEGKLQPTLQERVEKLERKVFDGQ